VTDAGRGQRYTIHVHSNLWYELREPAPEPDRPLVEDLTTAHGRPMFGDYDRGYLRAVRAAGPDATEPWRTTVCPECGEDLPADPAVAVPDGLVLTRDGETAHVMMHGGVVLGCEGFWIVSPAAIGIPLGQWEDWRNDAGAYGFNDPAAGDREAVDPEFEDPGYPGDGYAERLGRRLRQVLAELAEHTGQPAAAALVGALDPAARDALREALRA
jgi:hypothetical protein